MSEDEYIQLQNLLIKYRIYCMKMFGNINLSGNIREKFRKEINCIDRIRRNLPLEIDERSEIGCLKN